MEVGGNSMTYDLKANAAAATFMKKALVDGTLTQKEIAAFAKTAAADGVTDAADELAARLTAGQADGQAITISSDEAPQFTQIISFDKGRGVYAAEIAAQDVTPDNVYEFIDQTVQKVKAVRHDPVAFAKAVVKAKEEMAGVAARLKAETPALQFDDQGKVKDRRENDRYSIAEANANNAVKLLGILRPLPTASQLTAPELDFRTRATRPEGFPPRDFDSTQASETTTWLDYQPESGPGMVAEYQPGLTPTITVTDKNNQQTEATPEQAMIFLKAMAAQAPFLSEYQQAEFKAQYEAIKQAYGIQ